eukprot:TRINITY_DN27097_c0_g1_i1.p1 TRINITY_DN27097_c0_g1~~TRINITY_DN27097_c0_g1_i1.p1  ORF type:complete len:111 (-),score=4.15 TRINITY_DN27097_c0_g1_i1:1-309(-)
MCIRDSFYFIKKGTFFISLKLFAYHKINLYIIYISKKIFIVITFKILAWGSKYRLNKGSQSALRVLPVSYTHLRAHETGRNLVCRLLLEKKKKKKKTQQNKK